VNPVSGDFSVGVEGVVIRDSSLAEPIREATIASSIQRMLQHVMAVGSDIEWLPSVAAGVSLAIGDIAMSGT
jgi:PmbA protein